MNAQEAVSSSRQAWMALFVAGLLEMSWAIGLKYSQGFTRLAECLETSPTTVKRELAQIRTHRENLGLEPQILDAIERDGVFKGK